jgi:putative flippase GtrA
MDFQGVIRKLQENPLFGKYVTEQSLKQFIKYVVTGLLTVVLDYIILFVLTEYYKIWYLVSKCSAYVIEFWFNFLLNKYWSFNTRENLGRQLTLYGILFFFNLGVITSLMYLLTDILKFYYLLSNLFVIGMVTIWNFFLYKKVIYK